MAGGTAGSTQHGRRHGRQPPTSCHISLGLMRGGADGRFRAKYGWGGYRGGVDAIAGRCGPPGRSRGHYSTLARAALSPGEAGVACHIPSPYLPG
jgi:hypothetical protein